MTALIVDGDVTSRYILRMALARLFDWTAVEATDAIEGLDLLASKNIDLVFVDVHLTEMSALEMLGKMRAFPGRFDLPVIVLTNETGPGAVRLAVTLGAIDYLVKPLSADYIGDRLSRTIARIRPLAASSESES